jgi:hypothetical protein
MTSSSLTQPITESLEVTLHMASFYPNLLPESHKPAVIELLGELHAIQPLSLSAPPLEPQDQSLGYVNSIADEYLLHEDISPSWRKALEYKRTL